MVFPCFNPLPRMVGTVLITFALTELGFNASTLGLVLSAAGIGAVNGGEIDEQD